MVSDNQLKKSSGLLLKKLQHFVKDLVLFQPITTTKAHANIEKLANSFPEEPAF